MAIVIRNMKIEEAEETGKVIVNAFNDVFLKHGYPAPFSSGHSGRGIALGYAKHDPEGCVVAISRGEIVGSGFIHLRGEFATIGPVCVSPDFQNKGTGRAIMEELLKIGSRASSIRLIQDSFNITSFSLYTRLGFEARDTVLTLVLRAPQDYCPASANQLSHLADNKNLRIAERKDLPALVALDKNVTGLNREKDFDLLLRQGTALCCTWNNGRDMTGYIFYLCYRENSFLVGPGVAWNMDDLTELLVETLRRNKGALLRLKVLASQPDLLQFLLSAGFRVTGLGTFMVRGKYEKSNGLQLLAQFPEIL